MSLFNLSPALLLLILSGITHAQEKGTDSTKNEDSPNRETMTTMHRQMAEAHTKMAACLASDRPIKDCQQEMASSCSSMGGMMGGSGMRGMMGKGMMGKGMMGGIYGCPMMNDNDQPASNDSESNRK